jgi:hypothetical protein
MATGAARSAWPKALPLKIENIPVELRKRDQFVCWRYEAKVNGAGETKYTKIPMQSDGCAASTTSSRTWATFEECLAAYEQGQCDGVGFVTAGADPYTLIDLDHVIDRDTGAIAPWANRVIEAAKAEGAYIELSPSGTGVHIFGKGPQHFAGRKANDAEMYCKGRFFTLSGWILPGTETQSIGRIKKTVDLIRKRLDAGKPKEPVQVPASAAGIRPYPDNLTDQQILEQHAFQSANGTRLKTLLAGDVSGYPSGSEADLACASDLAFWFYLDPAKIEDVMRDSQLAREKWDENKSYLSRTIKTALAGKVDYYGKPEDRPDTSTPAPATNPKKANGAASPNPKAFNYRDHMQPVQELLNQPPPPIEYIVEDMIARGSCSLLIGKPKSYKTSIMLQIATALSGNPKLLDGWAHFKKLAKGGKAVFIDLEQNNRIFFEQITRMGTTKVSANFMRLTAFPKLDDGGVAELRKMIEKEKFSFVILDSLARVKPNPKSGNVFAEDAAMMQRITNLAHDLDVHIMVIAHAGKRDAADNPMEMIAGTNGLTASVDDVFVWFTPPDGDIGQIKRRNLFMSGRNIRRPGTFVFEKHDTDPLFKLQGSEETFVRGETKRRIIGLLGGGAAMTPNELAVSLGRDRGNVYHALESLVAENRVQRLDGAKYTTRTGAAKRQLEAMGTTDE